MTEAGVAAKSPRSFEEMVANVSLLRRNFIDSLVDPRRDLDEECGYPKQITTEMMWNLYKRDGLARRIVQVFPAESWSLSPEVYETEDAGKSTLFEEAWTKLARKRNIHHHLERVDDISGIGQFGVLFMGFDDGKDFVEPVSGIGEDGEPTKDRPTNNLLYMRAFDQKAVCILKRQDDVKNPRYGQPILYEIDFREPDSKLGESTKVVRLVHWSRVLHVADNRHESEIYGTPRMEAVFNRLLDLMKTLGGSGEMFWKGAFPGYSFEVNPSLTDVEIDNDSLREELEKWANGLQRYLALTGVSAKSLAPQVSDPSNHVETFVTVIAIAMGIPKRVFFGSEEAKLASGQDVRTWNRRLGLRQDHYLTPMVVRPFVERLLAVGALPATSTGDFEIYWPDLNTTTDQEKAQVALARTQALVQYVAGGVAMMMRPYEYLTMIHGMNPKEVDQIAQAADNFEELPITGLDQQVATDTKDPNNG
jgi:hypothetical protein